MRGITAKKILASALLAGLLLLPACKASPAGGADAENADNAPVAWHECLGDYSYDSSIIAMVYEQVEGEDPGTYGIQYREVTDLAHLTSQQQIPVCLYFYSSLRTDTSGMTAGMEDLAQELTGRVIIVAIDASAADDIADAYAVEDVPYFVLINRAARVSALEAKNPQGEFVNSQEAAEWLISNLPE